MALRRHGDDLGEQRPQHLELPAAVLIGHHAHDGHFPLGDELLQGLAQRLGAAGVVAAVQQHQGLLGDDLHPGGDEGLFKACRHGLGGDGPAAACQHLQHLQGGDGVFHLVLPQKRRAQRHVPPAGARHGKGRAADGALPLLHLGQVGAEQLHLALLADLLQLLRHLWGLVGVEHQPAPRLDDAGLLKGNLLQGAAQNGGVVQRDGHDGRHLWHVDDVGGVEPAAHAHLQHHDVALPPGKPVEGQGSDVLKLCHLVAAFLELVGDGGQGFHLLHQLLLGNHLPVDLEPLPELQHIGGGVQPHPQAAGPQGRGHQSGAGALAVGARHVDELQLFLGIAQPLHQSGDAFQPRLDAEHQPAVYIV